MKDGKRMALAGDPLGTFKGAEMTYLPMHIQIITSFLETKGTQVHLPFVLQLPTVSKQWVYSLANPARRFGQPLRRSEPSWIGFPPGLGFPSNWPFVKFKDRFVSVYIYRVHYILRGEPIYYITKINLKCLRCQECPLFGL